MRRLMLSVLLSVLAMSFAHELLESDCTAPALLQADRRVGEVQNQLVEEANSSKASKGGNTSKNKKVSNESKEEKGKKQNTNQSNKGNFSQKETDAETADDEEMVSKMAAHKNASKKDKNEHAENAHGEEKASHQQASKKDNKHKAGHGAKTLVPGEDLPKMPSYADADVNNDGVLTPKEFQKKRAKVVAEIEKKVHQVIKREEKLENQKLSLEREVDEMPAYEDFDKDRDGVMTPVEYRTFSVTAMSKDLSYKSLDQNNDGTLTPEEFRAASERWAAEMTKKIQKKNEELTKAREERRQLEQEIDTMQSYKDFDAKRDGVVTPAEYADKAKAAHGTWSVDETAQKAGAAASSVGFAGLVALCLGL